MCIHVMMEFDPRKKTSSQGQPAHLRVEDGAINKITSAMQKGIAQVLLHEFLHVLVSRLLKYLSRCKYNQWMTLRQTDFDTIYKDQ